MTLLNRIGYPNAMNVGMRPPIGDYEPTPPPAPFKRFLYSKKDGLKHKFSPKQLELIQKYLDLYREDARLSMSMQLQFFHSFLSNLLKINLIPGNDHLHLVKYQDGFQLHLHNDGCFYVDSQESSLEEDLRELTLEENFATQYMGDSEAFVTEELARDAEDVLVAALEQLKRCNYEKVVSLCTRAIRLNPESVSVFLMRSRAYLKMVNPTAAVKDVEKCIRLQEEGVEFEASCYVDWRLQQLKSIEVRRALSRKDVLCADVHRYAAEAYRMIHRWIDAYEHYHKAYNITLESTLGQCRDEIKLQKERLEDHRLRSQRRIKFKAEYRKSLRQAEKDKADKKEEDELWQKQREEAEKKKLVVEVSIPSVESLLQLFAVRGFFKVDKVRSGFQEVYNNPYRMKKYSRSKPMKRALKLLERRFNDTMMPRYADPLLYVEKKEEKKEKENLDEEN